MNARLLLLPMASMVLLTFVVLVRAFRARVRAVREGKVPVAHYALPAGMQEPDYALKPIRHFANLFEAPVLFYAGCLAAMALQRVEIVTLVLAWAYVAARLMHAAVHLGANRLGPRIRAYFASWLILLAFWINLVIQSFR
jgi:hypothetical protein